MSGKQTNPIILREGSFGRAIIGNSKPLAFTSVKKKKRIPVGDIYIQFKPMYSDFMNFHIIAEMDKMKKCYLGCGHQEFLTPDEDKVIVVTELNGKVSSIGIYKRSELECNKCNKKNI